VLGVVSWKNIGQLRYGALDSVLRARPCKWVLLPLATRPSTTPTYRSRTSTAVPSVWVCECVVVVDKTEMMTVVMVMIVLALVFW
jgi:hypothetical protein